MSMLRTIRLAVSRAIAPTTILSEETQADRNSDMARIVNNRKATYAEETVGHEVLRGNISTNDISDFSSDYTKSAICTLGSWSALARAYNQFVKNQKDDTINRLIEEFHAWNAVSPKQMDEEEVLNVCAKLSQVKPAKANAATDAIIARVRKCSIEELTQQREAKAKLDSAKREDVLEQFITTVWSQVFSDNEFQMPAMKAEAKVIQTIEWVASWQSNNPAAQAAELLLIESDIKLLRSIAKQDVGNTDEFVDGSLTTDGMMRLSERRA